MAIDIALSGRKRIALPVVIILLSVVGYLYWHILQEPSSLRRQFQLQHNAFLGTSPVWDVGEMHDALLNVENTVHYQLNGTAADAEWAALVPQNGGIVYVGDERRPFMPSVFHQLRCLDIVRQTYVNPKSDPGMKKARHCMNYLRQMIMCRANLRLEPVVDPFGVHAVDPWGKLTCKDWRNVYSAFEENQEAYTEWLGETSSQ
ncbi:hypothetical protein BDZ89DRAFT_1074701 [Hymenopellis radicata]|nr:hypothetical protein BDZ89DRAFT_1074701 [Hymenopellis radicata]